jgi:predicted Zn-dependent protease with MMP-like domain
MDREPFEKLVEDALAALPKKFKDLIHNVAVIVEDYPPLPTRRQFGATDKNDILGLYHGVPFQYRGPSYGNLPPDVIFIYQKPIEHICATEDQIRAQVQDTVIHEVGHYFGFNDAELRDIESEVRAARRRPVPKKETDS